MNVLYVLNSGNPGGLEQYTLDLVKGVIKTGNRAYVWCKDGPIVSWFKDAGAFVEVKNINFELDPSYIFSLAGYIRKNNIDIVHTGELKAGLNGLLGGIIGGGCKIITHIHTPMTEWPVKGLLKQIYTQIEIFAYSLFVNLFATYELALTESRKRIKTKEGIRSDKIKVIHNGFDFSRLEMPLDIRQNYREEILNKYDLPQDAIVFGNISRLTEEKGHEYLVRAFRILLDDKSIDTSKMYLFLGGGGKLEDSIRLLADKLDIYDRVRVTGIFPAAEWKKHYSVFDVYTFASLAEGFGLALIEGMYMGVPVICSDLEVLKEVGSDSVTYFKTRDSKDLYNKLKEVIAKNDGVWAPKETPAKTRVIQEFGMDKFVNAYLSLYKSVIGNK